MAILFLFSSFSVLFLQKPISTALGKTITAFPNVYTMEY